MKVPGAICPVCQTVAVLGPSCAAEMTPEYEAALEEHLKRHTLPELVEVVQTLRAALAQSDELRRIPYWAMPRA